MYRRTYLSRTLEENKKWFELAGRELTDSELRTKWAERNGILFELLGGLSQLCSSQRGSPIVFTVNFQQSSPVNDNHFILKIQVVSRAVGLLESQEKVIKSMSKSCPLHLLLCGRYCSFHTSLRKVRFNLEEKIVRTFSKIPLAMVYNAS